MYLPIIMATYGPPPRPLEWVNMGYYNWPSEWIYMGLHICPLEWLYWASIFVH